MSDWPPAGGWPFIARWLQLDPNSVRVQCVCASAGRVGVDAAGRAWRVIGASFCPECGRGPNPGFGRWLEPDRALASNMDAAEKLVARLYINHLGYASTDGRSCPHLGPYLAALSRGELPPKVERPAMTRAEIAADLKRIEGEMAQLGFPLKPPAC